MLRRALLQGHRGAAGLAALLALVAGLAVARRITRPVARLIAVTRSMADGDRASRAGDVRAPGELQDLAAAFNHMADTLDREDRSAATWSPGSLTSCARRSRCCRRATRPCWTGATEPTPGELSSLRDEVLRLARMVDDLQTLAADADAASLHLQRRQCDLAGIAAVSGPAAWPAEFGAAKTSWCEDAVHQHAGLGDPRWLHQVVTNLLGDAVKFTPAGGTVTIVTRPDGPDAVLKVADTGIEHARRGAAAHLRPVLARPERRADPPAAASAWRSPPNWPGRTAAR